MQGLPFDEAGNVTVESAAASDLVLDQGEPVLPAPHFGSGAAPCSMKWKRPPARTPRRASRTAAALSGMVHKLQVHSTASTLSSSTGRRCPSNPTTSTPIGGTPDRRYDVWHDRAVFHFLTDDPAIRAYAMWRRSRSVPAART